ncbi:MAG: tRNA lysidine(34) synthetase TilS [Lachnospiraceae bacterium]|nr:tRNA lysidine(34) synthetase TilS [Lachnospiraceae bacterium]
MGNTYDRLKRYSAEHNLISSGDGIVIALSGGADSVFLLYALANLREEWNLALCAVHVDHGIRGKEAGEDAEYCRQIAERLSVEFRLFEKDIPRMAAQQKISTEEAGRNYRYECLEQVRKELEYEWIAVAHHRDDQAETVLWQMLRGSGIHGLGGMRPKRGCIIRPLLFLERAEIETALQENGIVWREDSTNRENEYTRNKLRNEVFPYLERELQSSARRHLANLSEDMQMVWEYIEKQTKDCSERIADRQATEDAEVWSVSVQSLSEEEPILRSQLILYIMGELSGSRKDIGRVHVESVLSLLGGESGRRVDLPYGMQAGRDYDRLWFCRKKTAGGVKKEQSGSWEQVADLNEPVEFRNSLGEYCEVTMHSVPACELSSEMPKNLCTKWFDYDKINADMLGMPKENRDKKKEGSVRNLLRWRFSGEGDYLYLGGSGGKKKLARIFIDEKIPGDRRDCIPVLAMGSHILWIPELGRTSAAYYVTDNTNNVLVAQLMCKSPTKEKGGTS